MRGEMPDAQRFSAPATLTWVDVSFADLAALFGPVGELAGLDVGGADRVLARQGGGLAGVPVPVVVAERLYGE